MTQFFYTISAEEMRTLRTMAEGYARGHTLAYSGKRAQALLSAVAGLDSARALWREYQALKDQLNQARPPA